MNSPQVAEIRANAGSRFDETKRPDQNRKIVKRIGWHGA
jgi:hypothetical protein